MKEYLKSLNKEKLKNALEVIECYKDNISNDQLKSETWIDWHHLEILQDLIDELLKESKNGRN